MQSNKSPFEEPDAASLFTSNKTIVWRKSAESCSLWLSKFAGGSRWVRPVVVPR